MQFDAVQVLRDPVEYRIAKGWISHGLVPSGDRELAGDYRRPCPCAILYHLQGCARLIGRQRPY